MGEPLRQPRLGRGAYILLIVLCILPLCGTGLFLAGLAGSLWQSQADFVAGAVPLEGRVEDIDHSRVGARGSLSVTEIEVSALLPDGTRRYEDVVLPMFASAPARGTAIPLLWNPAADPPFRLADPDAPLGDVAFIGGLGAALIAFCLWAMSVFAVRRRETRHREGSA